MATTEQIEKVKTNLTNLIDLTSALLVGANYRIENGFSLLSLSDNKDLGLQIGVNLMDGAFWTCGDLVGGLVANFCCGVLSHYTESTPPSLQGTTSSLLNRFQITNYQFNSDLEMFHSNPEEYWDFVYSGTVVNPFGNYEVSGKLSDLSTVDIPGKSDEGFQSIVNKLVYGTDQVIWNNLLENFVITKYNPSSIYKTKYGYDEDKMESNSNGYYQAHPAYWNNWVFHDTKHSYYEEWQNNIGTGAGATHDGSISDSAANYLFSDLCNEDNPNAIQNTYTSGLFKRDFVFNDMPNMTKVTHTYNN